MSAPRTDARAESNLVESSASSAMEKPVVDPSDVTLRHPGSGRLAPLARIESLYDDVEGQSVILLKDGAVVNSVPVNRPESSPNGNSGTGLSRASGEPDTRKCSTISEDSSKKPASVAEQQPLLSVPDTRPKSRHSSGERKSRHWSGERRSRHPSKEKEPAIPKSERLFNDLKEAVRNDSGPRAKSLMKHDQLLPESRVRGLHAAVAHGSNKVAKAMLEVDPTLVHREHSDTGNTALLTAIEAGTVSTMSLLVDRGARMDVKNRAGETAWDIARRVPHDNKGVTPTLVGLYKQHSKDYRTSPIHEAAAAGDIEKINFLVDAGLDLWCVDRSGYNFTHVAAFNNRTNVIRHYLQSNASAIVPASSEPDVDRRGKGNGKTALHVAANRGHLESVMALLKCGATVAAVDKTKWTPLHDAVVCRHNQPAADVIRALCISAPTLVSALTYDGETPLHVAARHGRLRAVQALLNLSADSGSAALSTQDSDGWTPLHSAVTSHSPDMVETIINAMNRVFDVHSFLSQPDKANRTPLQLSQTFPDAEDVTKLLESFQPGASVNC